MLTKC